MARSKKKDDNINYDEMASSLAAALVAQRPNIDKLLGNTNQVPIMGLRLPSLALRFLFGMNILPFCRFYQFYGPTRSCKSAFLFDVYRWFMQAHGNYVHMSVEDKDSPQLRVALLNAPPNHNDRLWTMRVDNIESYMTGIYQWLQTYKDQIESAGVGRKFPLVFGIDSLMGKLSEATTEDFEKNKGAPKSRYPIEAKRINDWFRFMAPKIANWPVIVCSVNHDQPKPNPTNPNAQIHHAPGGTVQAYAATTRVLMRHVRDIARTADGEEGHEVSMKIDKGSLAPTGEEIRAELKWRFDIIQDESGRIIKSVQRAWWDWNRATVNMLYDVIEAKGERGTRVQDIIGLSKKTGGLWVARGLGMGPSDAVKASELGAMIEANTDIMAQLEPALEIQQLMEFKPGDDMERFTSSYEEETQE